MKAIEKWFFQQPMVLQRAALLRIVCATVVFVLLVFGPSDEFLLDFQRIFPIDNSIFSKLIKYYTPLKWITVGSSFLLLIGLLTRLNTLITMVGFFINCYLNYKITPGNWGYTPHIHLFLLALMFCQSNHLLSVDAKFWPRLKGPSTELTSFAISFLMIIVALIYFQAGVAKLFLGGWDWMLSGRTIYVFSHYFGTSFGHWLMQFPKIFGVFAVYTVVFELSFIFLIFKRKGLLFAFLLASLFHLGVGSIMTLSFWHLALLNVPLFLVPGLPDKLHIRGFLLMKTVDP